ncbi:MAG TPA: DUF4258 domain-containing protein [Thermoanaerobaculia bacterium]
MDRKVPAVPLSFIQTCVRNHRILWTYHVNMRLEKRFISRAEILDAADTYEVIEAYPEDKYLPSYLVFGRGVAGSFHVLFAADVAGNNVRVITAYRPDPKDWEPDLRTRRKGS